MESVLTALKDKPIPTILVIAGIVFLLLAIARQLAGRIALAPERQRWAAVIGGVLLMRGVALHLVPQVRLTSSGPKEVPTPPTSTRLSDEQVPQTPAGTPRTNQPPSIPESPVQGATEEKEPNDSITAANLIPEGTTIRGSIAIREDQGCFKFIASSTNTRIIIRKLVNMKFNAYDHVENGVASQAEASDRTITLSFKSTPGSTYNIVVNPFSSKGSDYELTVRKEGSIGLVKASGLKSRTMQRPNSSVN
jgi:hypothetical protein